MNIVFILLTFLSFSFVIFIHELGHLIFALVAGLEVKTFSLGFGKPIFSFQWKNIKWQIGSIPLGGYCAVEGEKYLRESIEKEEELPPPPGSLFSVHPFKRILFALGGPLANLILAFAGYSLMFTIGDVVTPNPTEIVIPEDGQRNFPSYEAGLRSKDLILSVNGTEVENFEEISRAIRNSYGPVEIKALRDNEVYSFLITPEISDEGTRIIGIQSKRGALGPGVPLLPAISKGFGFTGTMLKTIIQTIFGSISSGEILGMLGTPVGASVQMGQETQDGFLNGLQEGLFRFVFMISNLCLVLVILNLLPIPALDGGWILLFIIQWIFKRPKKAKSILRYQLFGFVFLLIIIFFAVMNDLSFIFNAFGG